MLTDEKVAIEIERRLQEVFCILRDSLLYVKENANATEAKEYQQEVAKLISTLMFDIWPKLYEKHPELKPPGWDG